MPSPDLAKTLAERVRGEIETGVSLRGYTTFRIGGPARIVVHPRSPEGVQSTVRLALQESIPWVALGLGSNVLILDRGFDGIVIRPGSGLDQVSEGVEGPEVWEVQAGFPTPRLARRTAQAGLGGVNRLIGVPGTVGGGVFMNAGAHGQQFADVVDRVELVDSGGEERVLAGTDLDWRYRSSGLDQCVVTGARIRLEPADPRRLKREIRKHLAWRKAGTPFNRACCGSVFKNPAPHVFEAAGVSELRTAGQLIDAAELKGLRVGDAEVSEQHANYIVNCGSATSADVMGLIEQIRQRVLKEFGVELSLEVKVVGTEGTGIA